MRPQYMVLAEFLRPTRSGMFDILGVCDRIYTAQVPAQHARLNLAILLVAESEDEFVRSPFRMYFQSPSNQLLFEQRGHVELRPQGGTWLASARLQFEMLNILLPEFGKYHFVLEVGGSEVASHPLSVVRRELATE